MRVRTLSQHVLVIAAAAVVAATLKTKPPALMESAVFYGGVAVLIFAVSLGLVDWHYQSAFSAIRNQLARYEARRGTIGPWRSHVTVRTELRDHCASSSPFFLLAGCGGGLAISQILGILGLSAFLLTELALFLELARRSRRRSRDLENELSLLDTRSGPG
jgi:hypothetical protein